MSRAGALGRGRESFGRQAWGDAYAQLSAADRAAALEPDDLERLAMAAHLVGRDAESGELWARAHHEFQNRGEAPRAARCAFWLALDLLIQGEAARSGGWIARGQRLLDDVEHDCVERGYLLVPVALRCLFEGDATTAHAVFDQAARIGERFGDAQLVAFGRLGVGETRIRAGQTAEGLALLDEVMVAVTAGELSPIGVGRGRPRDLPERHRLDPPDPSARRRRAEAMGPARPRRRDRLSRDRRVCVRFRPVHAHGSTGDGPVGGRLRAAAHRAGQTPGGRRFRSRSRGAGGVRRGRSRLRRRARRRHSRPRSRRGDGHRAGAGRDRRRRTPLGRRAGGGSGAVQRQAAPARRLLHLLERAADERAVRGLHPAVPLLRGVAHERRPDARHRRMPFAEFEANKGDIEGNYRRMLDLVPSFAERIRGARREARFAGMAVPNYFRKPFGPGWALVGDAGYNKDFITAQGIQDAFRDAELCVGALSQALSGTRAFEAAMADYQSTRDRHVLPMYEFTAQLATLEPPPPELEQLLAAVHGNQDAMDGFARVNSGAMSPEDFFSEANAQQILEAAREGAAPEVGR